MKAAVIAVAMLAVVGRGVGAQSSHAVQTTEVRSSGVLEIAGTPHPYLIEGIGTPCIVVGLAPSYPPLFSATLKEHVRFIFVDFKNTWGAEESRDISKVTMDTLVDELDEVRRALGLEKVCVMGHSTPGLVAIEYALRRPERVSHAVLVGVPPFYNRDFTSVQRTFWEADASAERKAVLQRNVERLPDDVLRTLSPRDAFALRYVRTGPKYFYDASYDFYWAWAGQHFSAALMDRFFKTIIANYDPRPKLASNAVPMLLVLGRYDYAIPYQLWNDLKKKTPHLTDVLLDQSSHFPMLEQSALFDEQLIRWLKRPSEDGKDLAR